MWIQAASYVQLPLTSLTSLLLLFVFVFFPSRENHRGARWLPDWLSCHMQVFVCLKVQTITWVVLFSGWGMISPACRGEIRIREAGSYLMLEKLKGEALPLRRSFDSWLLGFAEWMKATAALWEEGHTLTLLWKEGGTNKSDSKVTDLQDLNSFCWAPSNVSAPWPSCKRETWKWLNLFGFGSYVLLKLYNYTAMSYHHSYTVIRTTMTFLAMTPTQWHTNTHDTKLGLLEQCTGTYFTISSDAKRVFTFSLKPKPVTGCKYE